MKTQLKILSMLTLCLTGMSACSLLIDRDDITYSDSDAVTTTNATVETTPVLTSGDAADDPAIWIHPSDPNKSFVIGTNKKSGLAVYDLNGKQIQFLEGGLPNNIDIRQNVLLQNDSVDIGAFTDRQDNTVGWITISENGIDKLNQFPVKEEPYGFCLGYYANSVFAFVTYKTGLIEQYELTENDSLLSMSLKASFQFDSQLEGCVVDDERNRIFVGEEEYGIWVFENIAESLNSPVSIDQVGSTNGIVADIEGLALYKADKPKLIASSQGNDSFAIYEATPPYAFVSRFRITGSDTVDGAQETDGIEVTHVPMQGFPNGMIVAQDGFNNDGKQNFKFAPLNIEKM